MLPIFLVLTHIEGLFLRKELDGWDPEDDPWAEHVSHAKVIQSELNFNVVSWFLYPMLLRGSVPL